jgi:urease accessory protein
MQPATITSTVSTAETNGWQARLRLDLRVDERERTVLAACRHQGPLQIQRPFYPEADGACHLYILHPPGGVVGGDSLEIEVNLAQNAQTLITTPSAGRFYRSAGSIARQVQALHLTEGAALEWLPQETILFAGARAQSRTRVELSQDSRFLGWEILCLGRPAAEERFTYGAFIQSFELWRDGLPLYLERGRFQGGDPLSTAPWGMAGQPVTATLLCTLEQAGLVEAIRTDWGEVGETELFGATQLDGVLVCRYRGPSVGRAKELFLGAWRRLRPALLGKPPRPPRIWQT